MLTREIKDNLGRAYVTVRLDQDNGRVGITVEPDRYTVYFDAAIIEHLLPALQEFHFWQQTAQGHTRCSSMDRTHSS